MDMFRPDMFASLPSDGIDIRAREEKELKRMHDDALDAIRYANLNPSYWQKELAKQIATGEYWFNKAREEGYLQGGHTIMSSKQRAFKDLLDQCMDTYVRKNTDYGDSVGKTYEEFGLVSFLVRMEDKMNRLKTLYKKEDEAQVFDESIDDTLMDLANYALLALVERIKERDEGVVDVYWD